MRLVHYMNYDIKRGHYSTIDGNGLKNIMKDLFGNVKKTGDTYVSNFGAMEKLTVVVASKKEMSIETKMNTDVSNDVASDTVRKYNEFLLAATGFTTKERKKRINQKVKKGLM